MSIEQVQLHPAERVLYAHDFRPHTIRKHLHQGFMVTDTRVVTRSPNTFLFFFTKGYVEESVHIGDVADTFVGKRTVAWRLVGGIAIVIYAVFVGLVPLFALGTAESVIAVPIAALLGAPGAYLITSAKVTVVGVRSRSGEFIGAKAGAAEDPAVRIAQRAVISRWVDEDHTASPRFDPSLQPFPGATPLPDPGGAPMRPGPRYG